MPLVVVNPQTEVNSSVDFTEIEEHGYGD